jgi:hypothetical protein
MFSNELLLDAGDFDIFGWSSRSNADIENDSDFFVCCVKRKIFAHGIIDGNNFCYWIFIMTFIDKISRGACMCEEFKINNDGTWLCRGLMSWALRLDTCCIDNQKVICEIGIWWELNLRTYKFWGSAA